MCMAGFRNLWQAARGRPVEITLAQLKGAGSLPADFSAVDALGRGYRVLILAAGADVIDVMATEAVRAGDTVAPSAALLEAAGEARVGLVASDAPSRLAGPTIDHDVSAFQAAFAGAPAVGALAALRRFDHQAVYGGRLQRLAVPGFPEANRMESDLDMGGNAITGAGRLSAESLALVGDLEAGGDIAVSGDLTVGQAVRVAGTVEAAGAISADTASLAGEVWSGSLTVNGSLRAANISSAGAVTAGSVAATGTVTAGGANLERLTANTVSARTVTAGTLSAASVRGRGHPRKRASGCGHGRVQHFNRRPMHGVRSMKPSFALTLIICAYLAPVLFWHHAVNTAVGAEPDTPPAAAQKQAAGKASQPRSPLFEALAIRASEEAGRKLAGTGEAAHRDPGTAWDRERAFAGMERLRAEIVMLSGLRGAQRELLQWNPRADQDRRGACPPAGAPLP